MGFKTDEEYLVYKQSVSDFLWKEVDPLVPQMEETSHIPSDVLFPKFREKGLFGLIIPEEYGGLGLNTVQYLPILAELSKVSGAVRALIHVHLTSARAIMIYGEEDQKKEMLPKMATGESSLAFCMTEANSGSVLTAKQQLSSMVITTFSMEKNISSQMQILRNYLWSHVLRDRKN